MKIIIAGGGTGGHLFPGIALAQALQKTLNASHKLEVFFLCTQRPFDVTQLTRYKFPFYSLPSPRLVLSFSFLTKFIQSIWLSFNILRCYRPEIVIGLGGYGAVPPLIGARLLNIPIYLMEQNFLPGKVTRLFSAWARAVFCQWAESKKYLANPLRARFTGSPLRQEIIRLNRAEAAEKLALNPAYKTLAIIGGSQGAESINRFMLDNISILKEFREKLNIIHLTGKADYQLLKKAYEEAKINHYVVDFCDQMSLVYSCADLVLSRAGGIALAEITFFGLPMILVPYPYSADDHQTLNARQLHRLGAAELIPQSLLTREKMYFIINNVLFNSEKLRQMSLASLKLARPQAASEVISFLLKSIPQN